MITVIGGGPAGRLAALRLAGYGREVRLIDGRPEGLGGQCLHHGCMVINAHNDAAKTVDAARSLAALGILDHTPLLSYGALKAGMADIQETIAAVIRKETLEAGVEVIQAHATVNGKEVFLDGERETASEALLIATGSRPLVPAIPGTGRTGVYTAHTLHHLRHRPARLVIIGGGVVACEYAYAFAAYGTAVTMVVRSELLRPFYPHLRAEVGRDLAAVEIMEHTVPLAIEGDATATGVRIRTSAGEETTLPCDAVIIAAGLVPRTEDVTGIALGPSKEILVSDRFETSVRGVYAAGDVTGPPYLTPVARREGRAAADAILGLNPPAFPAAIPQAIKLRNEHSFAFLPGSTHDPLAIPSPAGPGSFWEVPSRRTGRAVLEADRTTGKLTGFYEASPTSSTAAGYLAWFVSEGVSADALESFLEVHPSSEGVPWLIRYISELREKEEKK
jgi:dihydrolipoamide dehydrogenase